MTNNSQYLFIEKINEQLISRKTSVFCGYDKFIHKLKAITDIVLSNELDDYRKYWDLLSINGNVLLYGVPGVGKTTIAYIIAEYALNRYNVGSYRISIPNLIQANLGKATRNMKEALDEIKEIAALNGAIVILDEVDRFSVSRTNENELSEMKRVLLELMDFLDTVNYHDKLVIIGITNYFESIDEGLRRRFEFQEEVLPDKAAMHHLLDDLNKRLELDIPRDCTLKLVDVIFSQDNKYRMTGDYIKKVYKQMFLEATSNGKLNRLLLTEKVINLSREGFILYGHGIINS